MDGTAWRIEIPENGNLNTSTGYTLESLHNELRAMDRGTKYRLLIKIAGHWHQIGGLLMMDRQ